MRTFFKEVQSNKITGYIIFVIHNSNNTNKFCLFYKYDIDREKEGRQVNIISSHVVGRPITSILVYKIKHHENNTDY